MNDVMLKSFFLPKQTEITAILNEADQVAGTPNHGIDHALKILRQLSLEEFGTLLLDIPKDYVKLRGALPRMASKEVQQGWTGSDGKTLLAQSCDFIRSVEKQAINLSDLSLKDRTVLDFGCGWGRLMRLMYYFTSPNNIYGVDAWQESLDVCAQDGVLGNLALSEQIPNTLPFEKIDFDLAYSFSVFTHLSERTTLAALSSLRNCVKPKGLLVITLRPIEYWNHHTTYAAGYSRERAIAEHQAHGFAFVPHYRPPTDGELTYGDSSISFEYLARAVPEFKVVGTEINSSDPYQIITFMKPF